MGAPLLVIAAGGTGGHMFPAQALAEAMLEKGWRVRLSTDARGARYAGGFPDAVEVVEVASATFARGGALAKLAVPFRILGGVLQARRRMKADRPAVVVGFGGYPAIPAMAAAWLLKLPRMIHEQNGVLGRVNQLFCQHVHKVACGTWPTELPNGVKGEQVGNPVRAAILAKARSPYIPPGDYPMSMLIMGGSQGARVLSDVVPQAVAQLPDYITRNLRVAQQAREEDVARVTAFYEQAGIAADVETFFHDVPQRMSEAQLFVGRSGASTVADVSVIGRPAIFVPFGGAIRDEQTANAQALVLAEAATLIPEKDFTADALAADIVSILGDSKRAESMARAAQLVSIPNATENLVSLVDDLAKTGS